MSSGYVVNPKSRQQIQCLRYLAQNFPTAVALPSGRISDYPGHLWGRTALIHSLSTRFAGPLRRFTHAAAVCLLGPDISLYFHRGGLSSCTQNAARRARLCAFILWHPPHPLSAALSLTSRCEMRAWGLPDIDCLACTLVLMMAETWNRKGQSRMWILYHLI